MSIVRYETVSAIKNLLAGKEENTYYHGIISVKSRYILIEVA
jgi:hypothetical protein